MPQKQTIIKLNKHSMLIMECQNKQVLMKKYTENMVLLNIHFLMSRLRKWYIVVTTRQSPKLLNKAS